MSSIPTSLIVVLLVAAWLVVLVPMFARRREQVPESDDGATGFRVLRRARRRRRPDRAADAYAADAYAGDGAIDVTDDVHSAVDQDQYEYEYESGAEHDDDAAPAYVPAHVAVASRDDTEIDDYARDDDRDSRTAYARSGPAAYDHDSYDDEPAYDDERVPVRVGGDRSFEAADAADEWAAEHARTATRRPGPPAPSYSGRVHRPGRGGYDPAAAEAARAYRYSRRRRVVLLLALLTAGFGVAAAMLGPMYWIGVASCALLLVGYLTYLRRQVRIENEIRERRMARLRRARQIRPEYDADYRHEGRSPYESETLTSANDFVEETFGARVVAPPAARRSQRVVLDLDDDDPAFDDLETYRPAYRRQAG